MITSVLACILKESLRYIVPLSTTLQHYFVLHHNHITTTQKLVVLATFVGY